MEPACDVGAGDHVEHGVVVAEAPHAEALAEIGVQIDRHGHDGQPTTGAWRAGPAVLRHELGQRPPERPFVDLEDGPVGEFGHRAEAEDRHGLGVVGHAEQQAQPVRVEDRHPAEAEAFGARGEPQILDRTRHRGQIHLRKGAAAEHVAVTALAECHDEQFGALEDALDLEGKELVAARAQRVCGRRRSSSTSPWISFRNAASVMRMNRHGCIRPTLGAACAACSSRASTSAGTSAPGTNRRMSRRSAMTR